MFVPRVLGSDNIVRSHRKAESGVSNAINQPETASSFTEDSVTTSPAADVTSPGSYQMSSDTSPYQPEAAVQVNCQPIVIQPVKEEYPDTSADIEPHPVKCETLSPQQTCISEVSAVPSPESHQASIVRPWETTVQSEESSQINVQSGQSNQISVQSGQSNQINVQSGQSSQINVQSGQSSQINVQSGQSSQISVQSGQSNQISVQSGQSSDAVVMSAYMSQMYKTYHSMWTAAARAYHIQMVHRGVHTSPPPHVYRATSASTRHQHVTSPGQRVSDEVDTAYNVYGGNHQYHSKMVSKHPKLQSHVTERTHSQTSNDMPLFSALKQATKYEDDSNSRTLNPLATQLLTDWYNKNIKDPYPGKSEAQRLATQGGISVPQVRKWFANKRLRCGNTVKVNQSKKCQHTGNQYYRR